jgi:hypothetical protein
MVALKQEPDDTLVLTGADEVLVLMGAGDVLVELDEVLLELDEMLVEEVLVEEVLVDEVLVEEVLVEDDRVKVLVLKVDDGGCVVDELVLKVVLRDTEELVEEDLLPLPLFPLPLPLPLPLLPFPFPLPLPLLPLLPFPLPLLPLPFPLPLLPLSFLANGLAAAHTLKRAAARRIGLTIVVRTRLRYGSMMKKQQAAAGANWRDILVHAAHSVIREAYTILPAYPDLYHGFG